MIPGNAAHGTIRRYHGCENSNGIRDAWNEIYFIVNYHARTLIIFIISKKIRICKDECSLWTIFLTEKKYLVKYNNEL